jgi:anhydro-N-acetylmuramic acid kinase
MGTDLYIGLMSGTSLDGVDGVVYDLTSASPQIIAHASEAMPQPLRDELFALNTAAGNELHRAALAANALVHVYAKVVMQLLRNSQLNANQIKAIGAHGQTVRHRPAEFDGTGYTIQLNNPALLAELTGIDVVADFRSRDVAAGGQGAPLVPAFHQAVFASQIANAAVMNIGGISNLSVLGAYEKDEPLLGFDCGPGNALMDQWCYAQTEQPFDADGAWAASGQVNMQLLNQLLSEPFITTLPPKSTGRDLFNPSWLDKQLVGFESLLPKDIQATLTEFTAQACSSNVNQFAKQCQTLIVCGGGALNGQLMRRLQAALPGLKVCRSDTFGLPPLQVEAAAFAWLASKMIRRETASFKNVTGAQGPRILGALYPA